MDQYDQRKFPIYVFPLESYDGEWGDYADRVYEAQMEEYYDNCEYNRRHGLPIEEEPGVDWDWAQTLLIEDRCEELNQFFELLDRFNAQLRFYQVYPDDPNNDVDIYRLEVIFKGTRHYKVENQAAVLDEEGRIRDWLDTVPEQYGFELRFPWPPQFKFAEHLLRT